MPGQNLKEKATAVLAAKKMEGDKKKAAELKAAKMMVGTAATKNKPVLNTKKVVIKAKYPRQLIEGVFKDTLFFKKLNQI